MNKDNGFKNLEIHEYSDKSVLVTGDTLLWRPELREIGGLYSKTNKGWIFAKTKLKELKDFIKFKEEDEEEDAKIKVIPLKRTKAQIEGHIDRLKYEIIDLKKELAQAEE